MGCLTDGLLSELECNVLDEILRPLERRAQTRGLIGFKSHASPTASSERPREESQEGRGCAGAKNRRDGQVFA